MSNLKTFTYPEKAGYLLKAEIIESLDKQIENPI